MKIGVEMSIFTILVEVLCNIYQIPLETVVRQIWTNRKPVNCVLSTAILAKALYIAASINFTDFPDLSNNGENQFIF